MKIINIQSKELFDIVDLTDEIKSFVKESNVEDGFINIQILHTSAALIVQENEPLLLEDIKNLLLKLVPKDKEYNHDDFDRRTVNMCDNECQNGHSHCKALFLPTSVILNIVDKELQLGTWQRVMFIELDRARPRKVQLQIIGK
jgi:secondary thiamine-phosphate synthase enzyme